MESFQDVRLRGKALERAKVRADILAVVASPWRHDVVAEASAHELAAKRDVVVLVRDAFDGIDESALFLWEDSDGYKVTNIVPRNVSELGVSKYNTILDDFLERVAVPAQRKGSFTVERTRSMQTIDDWLDVDSVAALHRFSSAANKSTGASHPRDQDRWFAFLVQAHRVHSELDTSQLSRWLVESEGWTEDMALELALDYEYGRALLKWYDAKRS